MDNLIMQCENEIRIRKRNLETKRQVQATENAKELEMLMLMDSLIYKINKEWEKED